MKCRHARRALRLRADEELCLKDELALEAHVADCSRCAALERSLLLLDEAWADLPEPVLDRVDPEAAAEAVCARLAQAPTRRRRAAWIGWSALAAASLLLAFIVIRLASREPDQEVAPREPLARGEQAPTPREPARPQPSIAEAPIAATTERGSTDFDSARLAEVRAELAEDLLEFGGDLAADASLEARESFATLVDLETVRLRRELWPVRRLIEGLAVEGEPAVGRAALHYLGVRGDRRSPGPLREALHDPARARVAVEALHTLGEAGIEGLDEALSLPWAREAALAALARDSDSEALELLAKEYARGHEQQEQQAPATAWVPAHLAAAGAPGLVRLIELHSGGALGDARFVELTRVTEGAAEWLTERLASNELESAPSVLLAAAHVVPEEAAYWLSTHLHDRRHAALCRELLPQVEGPPAVFALIAAINDARLDSEELVELTRRTLELDAERFVPIVGVRDSGSAKARVELVALLLEVPSAAADAPLLAALGDSALPLELHIELALRMGALEDAAARDALLALFERCGLAERRLAAACLIALWRSTGEDVLTLALDGASQRTRRNLLSILRRRGASERMTPSIYKLARELKPFLSERDSATRRSST